MCHFCFKLAVILTTHAPIKSDWSGQSLQQLREIFSKLSQSNVKWISSDLKLKKVKIILMISGTSLLYWQLAHHHHKTISYVRRACCYFIILSVVFPDGDRSLLVFLSDLLARWCGLGFIVVFDSLLPLSGLSADSVCSSAVIRDDRFLRTEQVRCDTCVETWFVGCFQQMHFDDDCEQTCRFCSVRRKWIRRK